MIVGGMFFVFYAGLTLSMMVKLTITLYTINFK
jgi:hypothetical protein